MCVCVSANAAKNTAGFDAEELKTRGICDLRNVAAAIERDRDSRAAIIIYT